MDADVARKLINSWRKCVRIDDPVAKEKLQECNKRLLDGIWEKIEPLVGDSREVFCSTDGFLGRFPLNAIRKETGRFLIQDYSFIDVPTISSLPRLLENERRQLGQGRALLVGGVNSGSNRDLAERGVEEQLIRILESTEWPKLPYSIKEVEEIKELFLGVNDNDESRVIDLIGDEATVKKFSEEAKKCQILHFAAHAYFASSEFSSYESGVTGKIALDDNRSFGKEFLAKYYSRVHPGVLTGLVLANDRERSDSVNVLTAGQISSLDLTNVELVVLSACNTGDGPEAGSEGLAGLQRAIFISGVDTCVGSLWKVKDRWSKELMVKFYRNLLVNGESRIASLRKTQLEMLSENPDPNYWAAWKLSGEWK